MTNILILNVGSSSLKFSLYEDERKIISGKCDRIGGDNSYVEVGKDSYDKNLENFEVALDEVMNILNSKNLKFDVIGHRIVHGGTIERTCLIDDKVEKIIEEFGKFAPLHNPPQLQVINVCKKYGLNQYGVYDTSFYSTLPQIAYTYALPKEIIEKHDIRKYGFHGISHKSAVKDVKGKTISCHLGNGSSVTASINGKAVDTSMGLTPLAGLVMATRCGDIDPALVVFLQNNGYEDIDNLLNKKSGFKGLCEITDIREILANLDKPEVRLAYDCFIYSIVRYVGSFAAVLNGVDNLIFTGGIGEHIGKVRIDVCKNLTYLGVSIKDDENFIGVLENPVISTSSSSVNVIVKVAQEEKQMVEEILELI